MSDARPPTAGFADSSVLVRYLTGDPPDMAAQAAQLIDDGAELYISDVAIIETAYVLTTVYRQPRQAIVDSLVTLLQKRNIRVFGLDHGLVVSALLLCGPSGRVSFGDAMIWAAARSAGATTVYSFDARFPHDGIEVRSSLA